MDKMTEKPMNQLVANIKKNLENCLLKKEECGINACVFNGNILKMTKVDIRNCKELYQ